jgi:uncharacterized repeat protein (TIGR02543 family)
MIDKKQVISHKHSKLLLDLICKKKRILFLTLLIMTFLLSSTTVYAPGSKASGIQNKFKPTSDQSLLPGKTGGGNKGKEGYLNREEGRLRIQAPSLNVELVGMWPYGACEASAVDKTRNMALIGNGYALQVLDISNPSSLSKIGEVILEGEAQDIVISGNYAYVVTHHYLEIVNISDLNSPYEVLSINFGPSMLESVAFSSGYVYVAASHFGGLFIFDVSNPNKPSFQASYNGFFTDVAIWGNYAICECEDNSGFPEYLKYELVKVIDVSNPSSPSLKGTYQAEAGYLLQGIDVSDDGYVYSCQYSDTDKISKIAVIDVATNPASPSEGGSYTESGRNFEGIKVSGNYAFLYENWCCLAILDISTPSSPSSIGECEANGECLDLDISGNFVGISHGGNGFSLYDVSNPANPSQLGNYDTPGSGSSIVASGDYVYIACKNGLRIIDVSNPSGPSVAGRCDVGLGVHGVAVSGRFAYCASCNPAGGALYIVDISSPTTPFQVAHLQFPSDADTFYELNDVAVRGDYAYVSGNKWISGETRGFLAVADISNPLSPSILGYYVCPIKSFHRGGMALSGNYAYLQVEESRYTGVRWAGLRIIDISNPTNPTEVGHYFSGREDTATTDSEGRYSHPVSNGWSGTVAPSKAGYAFSPSSRTYTSVTSDQEDQDYTATVADTNILSQLTNFAPQTKNIFPQKTNATGNLLSEANPKISGVVKTGEGIGIEGVTITFSDACQDYSSDAVVRGNYAYLAGGRFIIIDISDPENPAEISSLEGEGQYVQVVALSGDYAYLGNLKIIDISNPSNPQPVGYYYGDGGADVTVSGNYVYVPGSLCILKNLLAPEISITDPSAWDSLSGSVSIKVLASHSSGINRVEFYIDDELQSTDSASPYIYAWDTASVADGPHKIRARAYNNNGKSSDSEIEVTVRAQKNLNIYLTSGGTTDPETGTHSYAYGTEVTITAYPDSGYRFSGWTGDVPSGHENDNPLTIIMDSDKSITANFSVILQYTLTIAAGTGGTTTPAPGNYTHDSGTQVTITAVPDSGYNFSGWSGSATGTTNPITITMDSNKSITANFIRQYTLTIAAGTGGPTTPAPGNYTHNSGTQVTITAVPNSGYDFSGWSGSASGTTNPITIAMDSDKSITANFSPEKKESEKKNPCFIATAAYGSPLHPHLDVLRDFRDKYLIPTKAGRAFVNLYYKYSPSVANLIAKHKALKVMVRVSLLPLVAFSYSLLHFGPIISAFMPLFIFGLPVFLTLFFRRKMK